MKLILCICILAAGFGAGFLKAYIYELRIRNLEELITTLKILESEMKYRLDPLPELLMRVSRLRKGPSGALLLTATEHLERQGNSNFQSAWEESVRDTYQGTTLTNKDMDILLTFGSELGKTDLANQYSLFARTFALLDAQADQAAQDKTVKGKMYKSLGGAIGLLIIILLL